MRYIVVGPGAIGGTIGGLLARSGHDVVLAARGAHLAALRAGGLTVATPTETFTVRPPVIAGPDELRLTADDALILAVKSQDTAAVVAAWNGCPVTDGDQARGSQAAAGQAAADQAAGGQAASSQAASSIGSANLAAGCVPVFCVQNGVDNERQAARLFAEVYGASVQMPADLLGPGQVVAPGSPAAGVLEIGRYPSGTGPAAERLAADLTGSGFIASVTSQVMTAKYTKLLRNLRNSIIAACGSMDSPQARTLAGLAVAEAEACYRAAGIEHLDLRAANAAREEVVREVPVNGRLRGGGSTWQSLHRQAGRVEADYLNGEIVLLGRLHGVPTPVNELLRQTVNTMAARREPPGAIDPAALLARATR